MFLTATVDRWKAIRDGRGVELLEPLDGLINELRRFDAKPTSPPSKVDPEVQFNGYVELAFAIYVGKYCELLEIAADCINRERYVGLATTLRSVVEHCAVLHNFLLEIEAISLRTKWGSQTALSTDYDKSLRLFDRLIRGNTFAWDEFIAGNYEALLAKTRESSGTQWQVPVGRKALASLSKDMRYSNLLYNMLCDFVHPNMGGYLLLLREGSTIGGNATKTPAFDLVVRVMIFMLPVYETIAEDLNRVQDLRLTLNEERPWGLH